MATICVMCYCLLNALFLYGRQATAAHQLFGNMTYVTQSPYIAVTVTLVDGTYEWSHESIDHVFLSYRFQYNDRYVYGDFNHDGLTDAAVIITENEGGSGEFRALAFLINENGHLVHRASHGLGDRVIIKGLKERHGDVVVDMLDHGEHDCLAGPTQRVRNVYTYASAEQKTTSRWP